jgi:cephalosporin hydroxylase/glycosyltransferase involved in cell wall biosynthesis
MTSDWRESGTLKARNLFQLFLNAMRKQILLYTDDPGIGGVAQYNHAIAVALHKQGDRVTVVQGKTENPLIAEQEALGIHHEWLSFDTIQNFGRTLTNVDEAIQILVRAKPDLIFFSDACPLSNLGAKQAALKLGIPYAIVIGFVAGNLAQHFGDGVDPEPFLVQLGQQYAQAQAVIAVSQENLDLLHRLYRLAPDRGQVIHYGRPPRYFTPRDEQIRQRLRQELGIPDDGVVFFTAARLEVVKGYQYQLEAIAQLRHLPVWEKLYFVWAGEGVLRSQLEAALEELEVKGHVKLLGQRWDIPDWHNAADVFLLPSELEGMPIAIMEAMAKGLPVMASSVSGIPEELADTGYLLPDPNQNPEGMVRDLVRAIAAWTTDPDTRHAKGLATKARAERMFREDRMIAQTLTVLDRALIPPGDYVAPGLEIVLPDAAFPYKAIANPKSCPWPYLRHQIPHNWYVDRRQPTIGFLSRDEAHILYNTALQFQGKRALEIGCWMGWSACHLALAGVELDVIDPMLHQPGAYQSVDQSLVAAGVRDRVHLRPGYSPQAVTELADRESRKWSLIFIDGNHESPGPLEDAQVCEPLAEEDAMIVFHDLASPDVTQGLDYLRDRGWNTMIYQTMQIMGVAWRGNVTPIHHIPDPQVAWGELPAHLHGYAVSGMQNSRSEESLPNHAEVHDLLRQVQTLMQQGQPVAAMRLAETAASLGDQVPDVHYVRSLCLWEVGRHREALEAAKTELARDPNHVGAQQQVAWLTQNLFNAGVPKIATEKRSYQTQLTPDLLGAIQRGTMNYTYRGVGLLKNPFDLAIYPMLIWNLKPRTILEIGSKDGGSALWFGDLFNSFGMDGHVYSLDIVRVDTVQHPRVTFLEGDGRNLGKTFTPEFLQSLPRPWLVIDDADHAYETSRAILAFFDPYLKAGEYMVVEDGIISDLMQDQTYNSGPHQALKEFLAAHHGDYEIDGQYCDFFGYNVTWNTNGYLRKCVDPSPSAEAASGIAGIQDLLVQVETLDVSFSSDGAPIPDLVQWQALQAGGKRAYEQGQWSEAIAHFAQVLTHHPVCGVAHQYLSGAYWQSGNVAASLRHYALAQRAPELAVSPDNEEFQTLLAAVRPFTLLSEERLFSLYALTRQICIDDIPGNLVECGTFRGGAIALMAAVVKRYSQRPRRLYAFDTFTGMPDPTEADRHDGIPANDTGFGAGTLAAPVEEFLNVVCQNLDVQDIVTAVPGLFADTLPQYKGAIADIALLHADGDWYESTMDIFNHLYDQVVPEGYLQIDDYGHWEGCRQAVQEFERCRNHLFDLRRIDYTGVWCPKNRPVCHEVDHGRSLWYVAELAMKMGDRALAERATRAVLKLVPHLVCAEERLQDFGIASTKPDNIPIPSFIVLEQQVAELRELLHLQENNVVLCPDWEHAEEELFPALVNVFQQLLNRGDRQPITLLIHPGSLDLEEADMAVSSVVMHLFTEESLDITEEDCDIRLIPALTEQQWLTLRTLVTHRIAFPYEDELAKAQIDADSLLVL